MDSKPPEVGFAEGVREQAESFFGGTMSFCRWLPSERDRNYLVAWQSHGGQSAERKAILKVANKLDSLPLLTLQTRCLQGCKDGGCRVQQVFAKLGGLKRDADGNGMSDSLLRLDLQGEVYITRLIEYAEGDVLGAVAEQAQVAAWRATGAEVGKVSRGLRHLFRDSSEAGQGDIRGSLDAEFEWNLSNYTTVIPKYLEHFTEEPISSRKRKRVNELLEQHAAKYSGCEGALFAPTLTHHDPNDNNIVISPAAGGSFDATVLDFGDMSVSYPFADASIGLAYAPSAEAGRAFVDSWICTSGLLEEVSGLQKEELAAVISDFAVIRQLTSVCMSNFQAIQKPDDEYLQCSAVGMWKALGVE